MKSELHECKECNGTGRVETTSPQYLAGAYGEFDPLKTMMIECSACDGTGKTKALRQTE